MTTKLSLSTLRKDLLAGRVLYTIVTANNGPVTFEKFEKALKEAGMTVDQSHVVIDMLFDQGMVKTAIIPGPKKVRGIDIAGEARSFLQALYNRTSSLPAKSAS